MTTATLATDNATTEQQLPSQAQQPGRGNRITERDPDYLRLRAATERQLTGSLARLVREVRRARHDTVRVAQAQSAFIRRHTDLLRQAYAKAHQEGARDYFGQVSHQPSKWARRVQPSGARMEQRLLFYAAGSVTRMANEAALAAHQMHLARAQQGAPMATRLREGVRIASQRVTGALSFVRLADAPAQPEDMLQDWFVGMVGRLQLQSEITWNGLQDGYSDAGAVDPASPYTVLWWELGPVKTQHCETCPVYAAGSPYGRPGSGDNELNATPGDGHTDCGAACHCSLRYGSDPDAVRRAVFAWLDAGVEAGWIDPEALRADNEVIPTEEGAAVGVEPGPAYEDLPTDEVHLRSLMIDALDQYRTAVEAYQATIAAQGQPSGGLPDLLNSNTDTLAQMLEALPTLTAEQQRLVVEALDATAQFAVALEQAASLGFDALLGDVGYIRLAERWRGRVFYNPNHDPHSGRFAPGGAGGERESGSGGIHAPRGAATLGIHAHGGQGSAGSGAHGGRQVTVHMEPGVHETVRNVFGRDLGEHELAGLVGAQDGAHVFVSSVGTGHGMLTIRSYGRGYDLATDNAEHAEYQSIRNIWRGQDGKVTMFNNYFRVEDPGHGLGTRIFADQVRGASRLGVARMDTLAGRRDDSDPRRAMNGYYTWPRMGYNASLRNARPRAPFPPQFARLRTIRQLVSTPAGRDWWKANGDAMSMTFNLSPHSKSMRTLDAYLRARGMGGL